MKENGFALKKKKARSWRYPEQTITDKDCVDYITLLANTSTLVESGTV